ncbi:MAG TPA: allantoate amidohydrolase [Hyphomicrobiaceae bacterium]|nr:allantoate amidohydrolase [Hyphomicrobiaceae bacterium]
MRDPVLGRRLMALLDLLARHSDETGKLTRLYLSPAHKAAVAELAGWMRAAGLAVSIDALGTLTGRYQGTQPDAPTLLIGSHIDTVRDAGRYDGTLGVLAGLVAVEELARRSERMPFAIEIVAFGDEEGVRFPTTLLTSRALAGRFDPSWLDMQDAQGITLRQALLDFGGDPQRIGAIARRSDQLLGYIEVHIEQGPMLEEAHTPVGVVAAIAGAKRLSVEVLGEAGHAGTVPMRLRRDALAAASDMILAVERNARAKGDVVATVGCAEISPGAPNVIPGKVSFNIDLRAPNDADRDAALSAIMQAMAAIADARGVRLESEIVHEAAAVACSPWMTECLTQAICRQGLAAPALISGAGHDASIIASLCPVAMMFVRCAGGISHSPKESVTTEDADVCVRVLLDFIRNFPAQ